MGDRLPWLRLALEGLVIIASVLIALAGDAWWGGVQDRRMATGYYERLLVDLSADSVELERALRFNGIYRSAAMEVIDVVEGGSAPPLGLSEVMHRVAWAGHLFPVAFGRATFDEMVNAGRFRLIDDPTLSASLLDYYWKQQRREDRTLVAPREFSAIARRWLPAGFTRAAQECLWTEWQGERRGDAAVSPCRAAVSESAAEGVLARLRSEPGVIGYLREVVWFADNVEFGLAAQRRLNARRMEELRRVLAPE